MSNFSDNSSMVEDRTRKEPKRLKEIAMMKLIHMLIERLVPHISRRSYQGTDSVGDFGAAIREEILAIRDWIFEPLSSSVANDVQELFVKVLPQLVCYEGDFMHRRLKYAYFLVLHPKCRNMSLEYVFYDMIGDVTDMLQSLICLEHIELTIPLRAKEADQFTMNLKYCTRLKVFVHKSDCNDEIIKVLSQNCLSLSELNVNKSFRVTDNSVHYIKNMKSLRKCCINLTYITTEGIAEILKNCTQLYQLDTSYDICDILDNFENAHDPIKLSLRTLYLYHYPTTPRLLQKYCPFLTHLDISVDWPPWDLIGTEDLSIGKLLCSLNTFLIFENINVITMHRLVMCAEDLVELSNMCRNITELYVEVFCVIKSNMRSFSEHRPFQKLKILKFNLLCFGLREFTETHASIFKILFSYSTMVTHVDIQNLFIDDSTVETVFKTNKMPHLQYWLMETTVCTSKTFYLLFNTCPMLKFIGKLRTWEIHREEVEEIKNFIRQENYNLDIDMSDSDALLIRYIKGVQNVISK